MPQMREEVYDMSKHSQKPEIEFNFDEYEDNETILDQIRQGGKDINRLAELLDDQDDEDFKKWEYLRLLASDKYDFNGFDHINCYNRDNFAKGVLEALENTRRNIGITTAEKIIDFLYIFGYSTKRIIYILFKAGYVNFHRRTVNNYIARNKFKLNELRNKLMEQLNQTIDGVFQNMKANVMLQERSVLQTYLGKIEIVRSELDKTCPVEEGAKFNRLSKTLDSLLEKVKGMHGIESLREAQVEVSKERAKKMVAREIDLGMLDEELKNKNARSIEASGGDKEGKTEMLE